MSKQNPFEEREAARHAHRSLHVAVIAGGTSAERTVSLSSGAAVAEALELLGHHVTHVDPAEVDLERSDWSGTDIAFLALHGPFGEDGQVQSILESLQVPYTGSDPRASRLAISKWASKERFRAHGVPTAPAFVIERDDACDGIALRAEALGYPVVVKPDTQGSSLGVSVVREPAQLAAALRLAFELDERGIVEAFVPGREWTVGLIDHELLPLIEIRTPRGFFDYEAKYHDDQTEYVFDASVSESVRAAVEQAARGACLALGTRGIVRVDLRTDPADNVFVLEVNTIPGMTDHSLVPKAALRAGIPFPDLCDLALQSALRTSPVRI